MTLSESEGSFEFVAHARTSRSCPMGPTHLSVAITLDNYAKLLRQTHHFNEAAQLEARAKSIRDQVSPHGLDYPLKSP